MKAGILVYGYGNPGRLDDGLGPAFVRELTARGVEGVSLESGYQLQIEDAALVAEHDVVVFADADAAGDEPYEIRWIEPRPETTFTTHSVAPEALLGLAHQHFGARTLGFVLGIRGYEFDEFGEELSLRAQQNLAAAADFMERALRGGCLATEEVSAARER